MDKLQLDALEAEWQSSTKDTAALPDRLPLNKIKLMPSVYQCRLGFNARTGITAEGKAHVAGLVAALKSPGTKDLEGVTIIRVGTKNILIDGHHRFSAYKATKRPDIPVKFFPGSPRAALLDSGAANQQIKLTMSAAERSQWAWVLVKGGAGFTKLEIRQASGASDGSVASMRRRLRELEAKGEPIPELWGDACRKKFDDGGQTAREQVQAWAAALSAAIGPPKTFKTLGKKAMLAEALIAWSPRVAEELTMLMAEELDLSEKVNELVQAKAAELGEEGENALMQW